MAELETGAPNFGKIALESGDATRDAIRLLWLLTQTQKSATSVRNTSTNSGLDTLKVYAPVWTGASTNPTIGNGSLTGRFLESGRFRWFSLTLTIGSTTTLATGAWIFTLPSPCESVTLARPVFTAFAQDASSNPIAATARASNATTFRVMRDSTNAFFTQAVPWAWATGDLLTVSGCYLAA